MYIVIFCVGSYMLKYKLKTILSDLLISLSSLGKKKTASQR